MMRRSAISLSFAAVIALGVAAGSSSAARAQPCEAVVAAQLDRLQIDPESVRDTVYQPRLRTSRNGAHLVGYEAWVDLAQCEGSLVIDMSRTCRLKQVYTTGDCRVPGVKGF